MKQHAKVIINPAAGANSTHRKWPGISSLLKKAGLSFDYSFTEGQGHGIELARSAAGDGYRFVVAVGGDGTIHEVANGILLTQNARETSLGVVCTGTGSDLSRSVGIPHDYTQACSNLTSPRRMNIDIGVVKYRHKGQAAERYFVNSAGIGFDATVVVATNQLPKFLGGTIPYLTGLARTFLGYRNKNVVFKIGDRPPEKARVLSLVVANGKYFGGGMQVAPEAKLDDNLLDIVIVGDFGKLELLRIFPRIYKGTHLSYRKVRLEKDTRLEIESSQKVLLQADGEFLGEGPVSFSILPRALTLVVG
jgi:YegS/Rv2252/BmrU family lipid kinase